MGWVNNDYVERETLNSYHTVMVICRLSVISSRCNFPSSSLFQIKSIYQLANLRLVEITYLFYIIETLVMWA